MGADPKKKPMEPMGPYSPPLPTEAERKEGLPMAAANDFRTPHDAFLPTGSDPDDQIDPEVARRYRGPTGDAERVREGIQESFGVNPRNPGGNGPESRKAEDPPGYTKEDEHGFRHLKAYDDEDSA